LSIGIGKHHRRNGVLKGTYLTLDGMLVDMAYTTKRKHKCSSSFLKFADFIDKDSITMLFLQSLSISRKQLQNYYFFPNYHKKNINPYMELTAKVDVLASAIGQEYAEKRLNPIYCSFFSIIIFTL